MLSILVADDDPEYRLLVRLALDGERDLAVVGEAATAAELIDVAGATKPSLILLDASLPGGTAAMGAVREQAADARVVLTSSLPGSYVAPAVAAAGAVGSLAKDVPMQRLAHAIRELGALMTAAERALRTARWGLPQSGGSARESRHLAKIALDGWCDDDVLAAVELLISELVTNSIRHGDSDVDVGVAVGADHIRIEVADRSATLPVLRSPSATDLGGRGMLIVDEMATRWGVQQRRTGKCVWFELPRVQPA
jgi:DNA-binding NarL/FixJ family response regulator